jgi:hypothetical protein
MALTIPVTSIRVTRLSQLLLLLCHFGGSLAELFFNTLAFADVLEGSHRAGKGFAVFQATQASRNTPASIKSA